MPGERDDLLVARRKCIDQHLQVFDRTEDVVRESPSRPATRESSRSEVRNESPLPLNVSAAWLIALPSGPCSCPAAGLSCLAKSVSDCLTSSHSTGTAVCANAMVAPLGNAGPLVYAGASWMKRAATRLGDMMIARASAGTLTSRSTDMVIFTSSARGSIDSMVPTGTPTIRIWSPGYSPTAEVK